MDSRYQSQLSVSIERTTLHLTLNQHCRSADPTDSVSSRGYVYSGADIAFDPVLLIEDGSGEDVGIRPRLDQVVRRTPSIWSVGPVGRQVASRVMPLRRLGLLSARSQVGRIECV